MINNEENKPIEDENDDSYIDTAHMGMQCHLVIRDPESGEVILNTRG